MDYRAEFANSVLQLLYNAYNGNIKDTQFLADLKEQYKFFEEHVRNIYETFEDDIPLFLYHDYLHVRSADDLYCDRFEDMELPDILIALEKEIHEFYGPDDNV